MCLFQIFFCTLSFFKLVVVGYIQSTIVEIEKICYHLEWFRLSFLTNNALYYNVLLHCVVWYGYLSWLCLCVRLILIPFFSNACELLYFAGIVLCITYWNYFQSSWLVRSISPRNEITLFLNRMFNDIKWAYTTTYVQYRFKP